LLEQRIDADLALGRHAEILDELQHLAARFPTHENIHAQLMIALYRSGRQNEAVRRFHLLHERLAEELGLEPMTRLRRLHRAIVSDDPGLQFRAVGSSHDDHRRPLRTG